MRKQRDRLVWCKFLAKNQVLVLLFWEKTAKKVPGSDTLTNQLKAAKNKL